ncbi:MAG: hypothetical protein Q4G36_00925 [Paracoccus sp. (in: a-proteobacteria)]|nr:hypothetical protein [Paracoccus sp. (in: a-proteobacteria)]
MTKARLKIPGDRSWTRITSADGKQLYFNGSEEDAWRISHCLPPLMEGNVYADAVGDLTEDGNILRFRLEDGARMGNHVEIEIAGNAVQRVSVLWD